MFTESLERRGNGVVLFLSCKVGESLFKTRISHYQLIFTIWIKVLVMTCVCLFTCVLGDMIGCFMQGTETLF